MAASLALHLLPTLAATAEGPSRKIGDLELRLAGVSGTVDPISPVVPKNIASAVRIVVRAGGVQLSADEVARFVGDAFEVQAELSGPGLGTTLSLPQAGEARPADPLLLMLPPLSVAGDYALSNLRLVSGGRVVLDVEPRNVSVQVIDQVLVTSVKTRPLTLDEIRERGIVLDSDAYLGFEFTLGLKLESAPVNFSFPVVFDRQGLAVPQALLAPPPPPRGSLTPLPTIVPMLLEAEGPPGPGGARPKIPLSTPGGEPIRIPSVLVIPGNVGYLKQFFSAQLFVANGAPAGSGLSVRDVSGSIRLPPGDDAEGGSADDPLALPDTVRGPQPETLPVRGLGPDGAPDSGDDREALHPGEQGQAEFLIRGDREGFHTVAFDIAAVLEGLPVGPVSITGKASGGVLVRNPYFDVTFTAPAVVRKGEPFQLYATVTNIGQGLANDLSLSLDASRLSGARLEGPPSLSIDTLRPGDAATLAFDLRSERTGQVVASYLRFDTQDGSTGDLRFTLGVGERGVPLSPDTLVLPSSVANLPSAVVDAAMRVLGQAWSVANAPAGTLPAGVVRASRTVVGQKALALAEAGLRVDLGQALEDAVRDLLFDFHGPAPVDSGFDQLLRETLAGRDFAATLGAALEDAALAAGGATGLERDVSEVAASGPDFVAFAADAGAAVSLVLRDAAGRETATGSAPAGVAASVLVPLAAQGNRLLGLLTSPTGSPYTLDVASPAGSVRVSVTLPLGDGRFARYVLAAVEDGSRITIDLTRPERLSIRQGAGPATTESGPTEWIESGGPRLLSATVIGPETLAGAGPFGQQVALLFDRVVDAASAADLSRYGIADNSVRSAKRQLSGRLVFGSLAQPEGPYVPAQLTAGSLRDPRGGVGPTTTVPLASRLEEAGAVVVGRVVNADGSPVTSGSVMYSNNVDPYCEQPIIAGIAAQALGADGQYELRYVRRDPCGQPFGVLTQDPATGAARGASTYVRRAGERLVLDVVLLGRGAVEGTVRDLQARPVANADVVVLSSADSQSGRATKTDGDGRYRVDGITVGPVTVKAAKGLYVGQAGGRLDRAGSATTVDVTLNTGSVAVSGTVRKLEEGVTAPVAGVQVLYYEGGTLVGVAESGPDGAYAFGNMPAGSFTISAALNTRDRASLSGEAAAGDVLTGRDLLIVVPADAEYGTLTGVVRTAAGEPVADVIVSVADRGVLSAADGSYALLGVAVRPGLPQTVEARTRDGLRRGSASFVMNAPTTLARDVMLSGVGSAEFQVQGVDGQPLANVDVGLLGACGDPCGCQYAKSGPDGRVRFDNLPLGSATAQALRLGPVLDAVRASASLAADGDIGSAVLRFAGTGTVSGQVLDPDGRPSFGADVVLRSNRFSNDGAYCGLAPGESHRIRTDAEGRFRIPRVNLGAVGLTASQPFFPTQVGAQGVLQQDGQEVSFTIRLVETISGELSGTVLLPDGATPAGAGVEVTANGPLPDVTVATNAQGRFRFARIFPEGAYTITARDPVTGGVMQERLYLRAGQDTARELRLKGRGTVRVRVVDGAGVPVDAALVTVVESEFPGRRYEDALQAAAEGVVAFPNVFEGPFSVEVKDSLGRGGRSSSVLTGPGATQEVTVRLSASGTVRGHFYKRDGLTPIPFGVVTLKVAGRVVGQIATQGSGDVGAFLFDHVPAGGFELSAQDPLSARTASYSDVIAAEGEVVDARLVAQGVGTVQGLVLQNGEARGAANVALTSGAFSVTTATDGQGRYVVAGVPEGRVTVTGSLGAGAQAGSASGNLVGDGQSLTLDVALRSTGSVVGRVLRADGVTPGPISSVRLGAQAIATDAQGRFRFEQVPVGPVTLFADDLTGIDYARASGIVVEGQETTLDLRLNGVASAAVTVRDARGVPVPGASVWLRSKSIVYGDEPAILGVADPLGLALFPEIAAGRLSAAARNPVTGLEGSVQGPVVSDGEAGSLDISLEGAGRVTLQVLNHDGSPAPGARVHAFLPNGLHNVTADAAGRAAFENVKAGAFTINVDTDAGDAGSATGSVVVDATTQIEVRLEGLGTLRVTVQEPSGAGVGGVKLWANNREGVTGSDGSATLLGVRKGTFEVRAWDPARLSGASANVTLAPGGDVAVGLTLLPAGRLRGRVLEPDGTTPVAGAQVLASGRQATTDAEGRFEVVNLPVSGPQRADAHVGGRPRAAVPFVLSPESPDLEGLDLVLVGLGRVTGVVTGTDGAGAPSLKVRLQHPSNIWGGSFEATTDAVGAYVLDGIPIGAVTLSASDADGNRADGAAQLTDHGQTVQVDLALLSSAVGLPLDLYDANGFRFLVGEDASIPGQQVIHGVGSLRGPRLSVVRDGQAIAFGGSGSLAASALDRREVVVRQELPGLRLERRLYVPVEGYFGRYLDVVTNTGSEAVTLDVAEDLALHPAPSGATGVVHTSSGDAQVDPTDRHLVLDGGPDGDYYAGQPWPPVAVVAGAGGAVAASFEAQDLDVGYRWSGLVVQPGQRVALLHFLSFQGDRGRAVASAQRLEQLPPEALVGLTPEDAAAIANFAVPADLRSVLEPLPANDGFVRGRVLAGDGATSVRGDYMQVRFESRSPYYGRPLYGHVDADGAYAVEPADHYEGRLVVPRTHFDLETAYAWGGGTRAAVAAGSFPSSGLVDLTSLPGRTLRYSSAADPANVGRAVDRKDGTRFGWRIGDLASPGAGTPFFEIAYPSDVSVRQVRLVGADFLRARIEVRDALAQVVWSEERDLGGALDLAVPDVAGRAIRIVNVVDGNPYAGSFADLEVLGDSHGVASGRAERDLAFAGTGVVQGRLLRAAGQPYAGASLRMLAGARAVTADTRVALPDYRFLVVPEGDYRIEGYLPGDAPPDAPAVASTLGALPNQSNTFDLVFPETGRIVVRLFKADGAPAMASLALSGPVGRSAFATGSHTFVDLLPGSYTLAASRTFVTHSATAEVAAGADTSVDLTFPPIGRVAATVTSGGVPLAGADVSWREGESSAVRNSCTTDATGRCTIDGVAGSDLRVRATYPGSSVIRAEQAAGVSVEDQTIAFVADLPRPGDVAGTVFGPDGMPRVGATVRIRLEDGTLVAERSTNASGTYSYSPVPAGPVVVQAGRGFSSSPTEVPVLVAADATATADIHLAGAIRTAGDREVYRVAVPAGDAFAASAPGVSDAGLGPLTDAVLDLYGPDGALLSSGASVSVPAGAGGVHELVARAGSDPTGAFAFSLPSGRAVRRPAGRVAGLVGLRPDGDPADAVRVRVTSGHYVRHATTGASGAFAVDAVPAGPVLAEALDAEGVVLGAATAEVIEPGETSVGVTISPRADVTAHVSRSAFAVVGVDVRFESDDASAPEADRTRTRTTGSDGGAVVVLPAGLVTARVTDPLTGATLEQSGSVPAGGTLTLDIVLPDIPATVRGRITLVGGSLPAAGALVNVSGVGSTTADADGDYRFGAVPTGPRTLLASLGGTSQSVAVTVTAGADHVVDVTLPGAVLRGVVSEPAGPVAGATLEACGPNNSPSPRTCVSTTTASDGGYQIVGLPSWRNCNGTTGCYPVNVQVTARVTDGSGLSATTSFSYNYTLPAIHAVNLSLPPTGSVVGVVRDSAGEPSPGADVSLDARHAVADAAGAFRFPRVRPATVRVYAERAGDRIPGLSAYGDVTAGEELVLDVTLSPSGTIHGTLVDEGGQPIAGPINVFAQDAPTPTAHWASNLWVAADGTFSLAAPVGPYRVTFNGDENATTCRNEGPSAAEGELAEGALDAVALQRGSHAIEGILGGPLGAYGSEQTCNGTQAASDRLRTAPWWFPGHDPVVAPEAEGRALRTLREVGFDIEVRKQEYVPPSGAFARTLTLLTNRTDQSLSVELPSSIVLPTPPADTCGFGEQPAWALLETSSGDAVFDAQDAFAVARPNSAGIAYGVVLGDVLAPSDATFWEGRLPYDADGCVEGEAGNVSAVHVLTLPPFATRALLTFTVARALDDTTLSGQVHALADLSDPDALTGLTPEDRAAIVNFVLPEQTRLQGRVEDAAGIPSPGARVVLTADGGIVEETLADATGAFVFPSVSPGDYGLVGIGSDNRSGRADVSVLEGQVNEATVRLHADDELGLVLVHADPPDAAEGVAVTLSVAGYSPAWTATGSFDATGLAVLGNVPSGRVRVEAGEPHAGAAVEGDHVAPATTELDLLLASPTRVTGVVLDPLGTAVSAARVAVIRGGDTFAEGETDAEGRFDLALEEAGDYGLEAFDPASGRPGSLPVSVAQGQTVDVVVTLLADAQLGTLRVTGVAATDGLPLPGLPVSLASHGSLWTASAVLDALGQATVGRVPPGRVGIRIDGAAPQVGFAVATAVAQEQIDVVIPVGAQQAFPIDLTGADLHPYFARSGSVVEATRDGDDWACLPFCTGWSGFRVDGSDVEYASWPAADVLQSGRETRIGPETVLGLRLARRVFVPASGRFVRVLDVLENAGSEARTVSYYVEQLHSSAAGPWSVAATSSGDATFDGADAFAVVEGLDAASPAMAWVYGHPSATGATHLATGADFSDWAWLYDEGEVTLPPGQKAVLLRFAVQRPHGDTEAAREQAQALADLSDPEALLGLTPDERSAIVNFVVTP